MPNWTENELTISGPDVQKVLSAIRSEAHEDEDARLLDFDKIIPYPEQYRELDQRAHEYQEKLRAIDKDDPDRQSKLETLAAEYDAEPGAPWIKDGFNSGGYEWCWNRWGCYDEKTEVLTKAGWKFFREVQPQDEFFTLTEQGVIELHKASRYVEKPYSGDMYHFKTKLLDIMVTPDHSMYIMPPRKPTYRFMSAKDITYSRVGIKQSGTWKGLERDAFVLPMIRVANRTFKERHLNMNDFLEFLGYYISEGSLNKRTCKRGHQYYVRLTQFKVESRLRMVRCIQRLNFKMYDYGKDLIINDFQLYLYLEKLGHSHQKYVPEEIKELSARQLRILLDAMILGDGTRTRCGGMHYYTTSGALANDVQEIGLKAGYITSWSVDGRLGKVNSGKIHRYTCKAVSFYSKSSKAGSFVLREQITKEPYVGMIYCVVVPNHTLFVRRNGKVAWCGNTKWNATHASLTLRNGTGTDQPHKKIKCAYCQTVHSTERMTVLVCKQCGSPLPDVSPQEAFLEFDTAWSPPIPVIEKLAALFPDHDFQLAYFEGGMGFCGQARWCSGQEQFHHQDVYSGPRGG